MTARANDAREVAIRFARRLGVGLREFEQVERAQATLRGEDSAPGDVFWELADRRLTAFTDARDWDGVCTTYSAQARWLFEQEPDRPHREFQRLASAAQVHDYRERGNHRRVAIDAHCCPTCDASAGREYSFAQALEERPLPNPDCERSWCSCSWVGIPVRR